MSDKPKTLADIQVGDIVAICHPGVLTSGRSVEVIKVGKKTIETEMGRKWAISTGNSWGGISNSWIRPWTDKDERKKQLLDMRQEVIDAAEKAYNFDQLRAALNALKPWEQKP